MRAEFEEDLSATACELVDGWREQYGLAHVAPPVGRVELLAVEAVAGDGRKEGDVRRLRSDVCERPEQFPFDRLHLVGVERVVDAQPAHEVVSLLELLDDRPERLGVAGECDHRRAVDHRNLDARALVADVAARLGCRDADGHHAPAAAGRLLEAAAVDDDLDRVAERVDAGDVGRGDLADAVADDFRRRDAPRLPQLGQCEL